jgi:hypothetical protein
VLRARRASSGTGRRGAETTVVWIKRVALLAAVAITLGTGGGFLYYRYAPRRVPSGQPPLTYLSAATFGDLRAAFNAASDGPRLLLLMSPT